MKLELPRPIAVKGVLWPYPTSQLLSRMCVHTNVLPGRIFSISLQILFLCQPSLIVKISRLDDGS